MDDAGGMNSGRGPHVNKDASSRLKKAETNVQFTSKQLKAMVIGLGEDVPDDDCRIDDDDSMHVANKINVNVESKKP